MALKQKHTVKLKVVFTSTDATSSQEDAAELGNQLEELLNKFKLKSRLQTKELSIEANTYSQGASKSSTLRAGKRVSMNEKNDSIGLTQEQSKQLGELAERFHSTLGKDIQDPDTWFGNHLSSYLRGLWVDAEIELSGHRVRKSTKLRRDAMLAFKNYFGRPATADDLLNRLSSAVGKINDEVSEAIRRDVERLQSRA
jgi:hypothetical protein